MMDIDKGVKLGEKTKGKLVSGFQMPVTGNWQPETCTRQLVTPA